MRRFKKIVVPTDFSPCSRHAFEYVRSNSPEECAEQTILVTHVFEPPIYPAMFEGGALAVPSYDDGTEQRIREHLEELTRNELEGMQAQPVLLHGQPATEVVGLAKREQADLIVIATHGHTGFRHLLLGSTAEQIVRQAECAVLTVHPPRG